MFLQQGLPGGARGRCLKLWPGSCSPVLGAPHPVPWHTTLAHPAHPPLLKEAERRGHSCSGRHPPPSRVCRLHPGSAGNPEEGGSPRCPRRLLLPQLALLKPRLAASPRPGLWTSQALSVPGGPRRQGRVSWVREASFTPGCTAAQLPSSGPPPGESFAGASLLRKDPGPRAGKPASGREIPQRRTDTAVALHPIPGLVAMGLVALQLPCG